MLVDRKTCRKCGISLPAEELPGRRRVCAACKKAATKLRSKKHYEADKERILARQKAWKMSASPEEKERRKQVLMDWRARNAERIRGYWDSDKARAWRRKWYENPKVRARHRLLVERYFSKVPKELLRWRSAEYARNNRHLLNARDARRRAAELRAVPRWADRAGIEQIYKDARDLTRTLGQEWHVDHIVPLRSDVVCGLHVVANLQLLEAGLNRRKSNSFWPDMP